MRVSSFFSSVVALALALALGGCGTDRADASDANMASVDQAVTAPVCGATQSGAVQGRDVSRYQGAFDWAGAKVPFGYAQVSDGLTVIDPTFGANWSNMKAAGVLRGAYQFFEPSEDEVAQANLMVSKVGQLGEGDLPCAIDVEATGGQSGATIAAKVRTWLEIVEKGTGKRPVIYTGAYFWDDNVGDATFGSYPLWIAAYVPTCPRLPNGWSSWAIWQYGDGGGQLDHDVFNGTLADLQALAKGKTSGSLDVADCTHVTARSTAGRVRFVFDDAASMAVDGQDAVDVRTPTGLLDGKPHAVRAYAGDASGALLEGSPRSFTCAPRSIAEGARKRVVRSLGVLEAWRFSSALDVADAPITELARLSWDPDLEPTPRVVRGDDGAAEIWVIDGIERRHVTSPASMTAWRFGAAEVWPAARLAAMTEGRPWPVAPYLVHGASPDEFLMIDDATPDSATTSSGAATRGPVGAGGSSLDDVPSASGSCTAAPARGDDVRTSSVIVLVMVAAVFAFTRRRSRRATLTAMGITSIVSMVSVVGCSTASSVDEDEEHTASVSQSVDLVCGGAAADSIDGIPAYPYCGNFDVWSKNGVDVQATQGSGPGWIRSEAGYGFQCFELAVRYLHFKFGVQPSWPILYASQMCTNHPAGVVQTQNPVHGDLIVFAGGSCGVAAPAGHVAVIDTVGPSTVTAVQQNIATRLTWQKSCASCFLHAIANGSNDPCASALDGFYCAASSQFPGGKTGDYYDCRGGATKSKVTCSGGCEVSPPGVEDICHQASGESVAADGGAAADATTDATANDGARDSDSGAGVGPRRGPSAAPDDAPADAIDAGCSVTSPARSSSSPWLLVAMTAIAACMIRRRSKR